MFRLYALRASKRNRFARDSCCFLRVTRNKFFRRNRRMFFSRGDRDRSKQSPIMSWNFRRHYSWVFPVGGDSSCPTSVLKKSQTDTHLRALKKSISQKLTSTSVSYRLIIFCRTMHFPRHKMLVLGHYELSRGCFH